MRTAGLTVGVSPRAVVYTLPVGDLLTQEDAAVASSHLCSGSRGLG